jgi:hypothetical protein
MALSLQWASVYWSQAAMAIGIGGLGAHLLNQWLVRRSGRDTQEIGRSSIKRNQDILSTNVTLQARLTTLAVLLVTLTYLPIIPVATHHLSLAAIFAGVLSEISSLSIFLLMTSFILGPAISERRSFLFVAVLAGLLLYWSVLTYGAFDIYRLGYIHAATGPLGTLSLLIALALFALFHPLRIAIPIALACISWALHLQSSTNLWDYLLDVPSVLLYLGLLLRTYRTPVHA